MQNNEIQFLDALIFIENSEIKFKKHDVSPLKYKHNIFTSLHRTRDCCSDNEQFKKCLVDLRIIYSGNSYPTLAHRAKNKDIFRT